jgi:Restriction endonuclease
MVYPPTLAETYEELAAERNAQARGIAFEALVARLFEQARFKVDVNPRTARPRQSDLLAHSGRDTYLVETKWTKAKATVADVDSLFRRLDDTPPSIVGVLVSVSGFTKTAINRVEAQRSRPLVLINGQELEYLWLEPGELRRLLSRKQRHLLAHARMAFGVEERAEQARGLVDSPLIFVWPDGKRTSSLVCSGDFDQFVFALDLPDIDWAHGKTGGIELDVPLELDDEESLIDLVAALAEIGFVSTHGHWSIQQSSVNWHGFGAAALARALRGRAERYAPLVEAHHTEQVIYHDVCEGGFYVITADIAARRPHAALHSQLSLQLEGQPVVGSTLDDLLEVARADPPLFMRTRLKDSVEGGRFRRESRPAVQVRGYVVQPPQLGEEDEEWVSGLVMANPFVGRGDEQPEGTPDWWPPQLAESEVLICSLRSWHPLAEPRESYHLERAEWAETAEALVMRLIGNW